MHITILYLLSLAHVSLSWIPSAPLSALLTSALPTNLSDFTMANSYSTNTVIIFGGTDGTSMFNQTFVFNLTAMTWIEITSTGPSARMNPCSMIHQDQFYIFGGQNDSLTTNKSFPYSNELWKLNITTQTWRLLDSSTVPLLKCQLYLSDQTTIVKVGRSFSNLLIVAIYHISNSSLEIPTVEFYSRVLISSTLWDGSIVTSSIKAEYAPSNLNQSQYQTQNYMQIDPTYPHHITDSSNSTTKILSASGHIYSLVYIAANSTMQIRYLATRQYKLSMSELMCQSVNYQTWDIFCCLTPTELYIDFFNSSTNYQQRVNLHTVNFYQLSWPNFNGSSYKFSIKMVPQGYQPSILLIVHQTLLAYHLPHNVYGVNSTPVNVKSTFFGMNQCQSGWQVPSCLTPTCPNSLVLNSQQGLRVIQMQCSSHGTCTNGTCVCDSLWEGSDCSIYKRKSCLGTSLTNFPLVNCECMDPTLGGNDCSVQFCPSDCSGHGTCSNGVCTCNSRYYGVDCSIMIVGFQL